MKFLFLDSSSVLSGDRVLLQVGPCSIFWAGSDWGSHWRISFALDDSYMGIILGRLSFTVFRRGYY